MRMPANGLHQLRRLRMNDVVGLQRVVADLILDDNERRQWEADPTGYASRRLPAPAARALARLDPVGFRAMARSHSAKKERFDHLHRLHHEYEDQKAARRAAAAGHTHEGHSHHDHDHPHDHDHDHTHDHTHDHDHGGVESL
jgi:hypothetical protein